MPTFPLGSSRVAPRGVATLKARTGTFHSLKKGSEALEKVCRPLGGAP